jgi:two-component system response regulator HydG
MNAVDPGIFEAWLVSTDDGVVAVDAEGLVVLHNPAASRVTGLAPPAALRRPWREVLQLEPGVADLLSTARTSGRRTTALASVLWAQGNLRTAELLAQPWTDTGGRTGILILLRDLTVLCRNRSGPGGRTGYGSLVGADPAMTALYDLIEAVAPSDAPVVIEGAPGAGKELVAQAIHGRSRRAERPLIVVDCAAASPLLESELFGRLRPGPHGTTSIGRVELAHSGTLLLKRVSGAPPSTQARLLRLLETGIVERDGEGTPRRVDVRVIVATSRPLDLESREGRFRDDLLRRLQVVRIRVPPLRERRGDIALLAEHFLARHGATDTGLSAAAAAVLQACDWPGNVRQLETVMREVTTRTMAGERRLVEPQHLPETLLAGAPDTSSGRAHFTVPPYPEDRRTILLRALSSHGGNRTAAARALGIGRATFYRWWRAAGLGVMVR